jgi:hypothetical protein
VAAVRVTRTTNFKVGQRIVWNRVCGPFKGRIVAAGAPKFNKHKYIMVGTQYTMDGKAIRVDHGAYQPEDFWPLPDDVKINSELYVHAPGPCKHCFPFDGMVRVEGEGPAQGEWQTCGVCFGGYL